MKLTWWNQKTYEDVKNFYDNNNRCAINNATGTGKTSVISNVINDYYDIPGSVIVIAPKKNIYDQYKKDMYGLKNKDIIYKTYNKLANEYKNNILDYKNLKLIVCDELHRTGAKTWMPAVEYLIELNPHAKILGASATPRRTDQRYKNDDMVDILFDGNRAGNFDIVKCLKENILPLPIYVSTLYEKAYDEMENELIKKIYKIKNDTKRKEAMNQIKECRINWEASFGYDNIISTFLNFDDIENENSKILIFCKGKEHIKEMRDVLDIHFKNFFVGELGLELSINEYHNGTKEKPFEDFRDDNSNGKVQILYSIDKFEEGVHVDKLKAIIMIRDTMSEIKYFQQIGRVLSLSGSKHPVIIDLVANRDKVKGAEMFSEAGMEIENDFGSIFENGNMGKQSNGSTKTRDIPVKLYDTVENSIKVFEDIKNNIYKEISYNYKGEDGTISYFAEKYNKDSQDLYNKVNKQGMSIKEAIETSLDAINYNVNYKGEIIDVNKLCKRKGINNFLFDFHYKKGKTAEEIVTMWAKRNKINNEK